MPEQAPAVELPKILRLLRGASVTVFSQDTALRYRWLENPPVTWSVPPDILGKTDADLLPAAGATATVAAKRTVLATGRPHWAEFTVEQNYARQHFELYAEPERDAEGTVIGVTGLVLDVSERRQRQAALEAMVRQSSHRSKNLLAILQSLAVQTARTTVSTDDFIDQFRNRIQSISRSQDIALATGVHSGGLSALIAAQVKPFVDDADKRIRFSGPDCELTPNSALHIGLALSELTVASGNRGALSVPDGWVEITSTLVTDASIDSGEPCLRLEWSEHAGETDGAPHGFAKQLLERLIPSALGGHSTLEVTDGGTHYVLTAAPGQFRHCTED